MKKLLILITLFVLSGCYMRPVVHYHPYRKTFRVHKVPTFRYYPPMKPMLRERNSKSKVSQWKH